MATDLGLARRQIIRAAQGRRSWPLGRLLLTVLVVAWFAVLVLVPLLALLQQAWAMGAANLLRRLITPEFLGAFQMTLAVTAVATVVNTLFGVAFALVLVRQRFWGRGLADALLDLPFAISPVVAGLMLVVLYGPEGWIGRWLAGAGIQVVYSLPGMVLATMFVTLPFVVREVVPVLREFGLDQVEASYTLGAGRWMTFWRVTLPSIRWGLGYGVILMVARSLGEFGAVLVVSGNLLGQTQTATLYVHDGIESFEPSGAYAASIALTLISFVLMSALEWLRKRCATFERG
jgi:sulfate transport system permease protein